MFNGKINSDSQQIMLTLTWVIVKLKETKANKWIHIFNGY